MIEKSTDITLNASPGSRPGGTELWRVVRQPIRPTLARNEIHLWCAPPDEFISAVPEFYRVLSPAERTRAQSFQFPKDRDRFLIQWGLLRHLLSGYLTVAPAELEFVRGPFGKPELAAAPSENSPDESAHKAPEPGEVGRVTPCAPFRKPSAPFHASGAQRTARPTFLRFMGSLLSIFQMHWDHEPRDRSAEHRLGVLQERFGNWPRRCSALRVQGKAQLHFNLSHSHSLALYAFSHATAVGVDIERIGPMADLESIARNFFTPRETAALAALPDASRLEAFFNCWTRKEAILKATGQGIREGVDGVEVNVATDEPARVLSLKGDAAAARGWSLHSLQPATGYAAALAYQGPELKLVCHALHPEMPGSAFFQPVNSVQVG